MFNKNSVPRTALLACSLTLVIAGCGKRSDQDPTSTGQVAAQVGSDVVTSLELDNEFRIANVPANRRKDVAVVAPALDQLVLRKYLARKAIESKLDLEPAVQLNLTRAREQVLANAYMMREAATSAISKDEVTNYIARNPAQFAERHVLSIDQVRFGLTPAAEDFALANRHVPSLADADARLSAAGIEHNRSVGVLSVSDLPADFAAALHASKPNEVFYARSGAVGLYFTVMSEALQPLEGEAATRVARSHLEAERIKAAIEAANKSAQSETEFVGDYFRIMAPWEKTSAAKTEGSTNAGTAASAVTGTAAAPDAPH